MSIKDLIWVNVAQGLKIKRESEEKIKTFEIEHEMQQQTLLTMCDLRDLLLETHLYTKANALKGSKGSVSGFNIANLTSSKFEKEQKEQEKIAKMTPEELEEYEMQKLLAGEVLR